MDGLYRLNSGLRVQSRRLLTAKVAIFSAILRASSSLSSLVPCDVQSLFQVVSIHHWEQLKSCIQTREQRLSYSRNLRCILHVEKHHRTTQTILCDEVSSFRLQLAHGG